MGCATINDTRSMGILIVRLRWLSTLGALIAFSGAAYASGAIKAGAGRCVITPEQSMWMAGYASRKSPSEGKVHDLWAKALAFEDETGARSVVLTTDLVGIPAALAHQTAALVQENLGIPRERLMITSSHTHCGPVTRDILYDMYGLEGGQAKLVADYTAALPEKFLKAIQEAVDSMEGCTLTYGIGDAGFGKNRRQYTVDGIANGFNPIGPVDHDVPALVARRADGSVKAVLFGYACHNTTLSFQQFCGDYAGFAQIDVEAALPGAVGLFVSGCGADQNPLPRGKVEQAMQYGRELAGAVLGVVNRKGIDVRGPLRCAYKEIPLALSPAPTREQVEARAKSDNVYEQRLARRLLQTLDEKGGLDTIYPYPVQVWQFADSLQLTALAGEVVVDYSHRLKYELGRERQFIIAYANDVCAYIPSLRILKEGGYEGAGAMVYYGFYGPWAPTVEDDIVRTVLELSRADDRSSGD